MEVHQRQQQRQQQYYQYPDDFKCPISLEVMSDPVILTSGHTFDRVSIQRWLDSGNRTCPVTKLPLPSHPPLIPNHALRSLISSFSPPLSACRSSSPSSLTGTLDDVSVLSFPSDANSLSSLRRLCRSDPSIRRRLIDSGTVPVLLRHVSSPDSLQDPALRLFLDLSLDGDDAKVGLVADGAVNALVSALLTPSTAPSSRALAATALTSLAVADVNKCSIGAHPLAIPALVALLSADRFPRERREAATALYALCSFPENRRRAARSDAVPPLVILASSGLDRAVEVLALLAKCREGKECIRKIEGFAGVMATVVRRGSRRGVEHALIALNLVCGYCKEMLEEVRREGILEVALELMADDKQIGKLAAALVQLLQDD